MLCNHFVSMCASHLSTSMYASLKVFHVLRLLSVYLWAFLVYLSRATGEAGMNREEAPGKSPEDMYIQQKVRVLLMLKKMGSNVSMMHTFLFKSSFFVNCLMVPAFPKKRNMYLITCSVTHHCIYLNCFRGKNNLLLRQKTNFDFLASKFRLPR